MFGLGSHAVINAVIAASLSRLVSADYFTNPASFITVNGTVVKTQDLSTTFTLGQAVQITWSTTLSHVSLVLAHWDVNKGVALASFMTNDANTGFYTWNIGANDGVDERELAISPNFEFQLSDPTGQDTSTGNPPGFIDHTLTSRGFVIKSNATSSSPIAPSSPIAASSLSSTISASLTSTLPISSVTSASPTESTIAASKPHSGLSTGGKVVIAVGVLAAAVAIAALVFYFKSRRRRSLGNKSQMQEANEVSRNMELLGAVPTKVELHAVPSTQPQYGELSGSTSFHLHRAELSAERQG